MDASSSAAPQHCPACGVELDRQSVPATCPACGAAISVEGGSGLSETQRADLLELIEQANEKLLKIGADRAEQSFGLGCLVVALPAGAAILILNLTGVFNLIMLLVALVMAAIVSAGLAALLALSARKRAMRETYRKEIQLEIETALDRQNLPSAFFDRLVHQTLPSEAPLRAYRQLESSEITAS